MVPLMEPERGPVWHALSRWLGWNWLSAGNLLALAGLVALLLTSPQFQVTQVVIARESASAAAAMTRAHEVSNVVGTSIFLLHTERLAREIEAIPSVRSAQVRARLPNRVIVEIAEREPVAVWRAVNGTFLVDPEGQIIGSTAADAPRLPAVVIHETNGVERAPGHRIERKALLTARELRRVLPDLGVDPLAIEYGTTGLTVVSGDGWRIIFGDLEQLNAKLENLAAILDMQRRQPEAVEMIDLRPVERPYYRLIPTPTVLVPTVTAEPR